MKITDLDEGIFDLFSRGSQASGLNNIGNMTGKTQADMPTVARKAKELLDQGTPEQQVIQALQQEFGVNPRIAAQAMRMAQAGVGMNETTSAGAVAAVAAPLGKTQKRNMYNTDGTMKNALDTDSLLSGSSPKKNKTSKKA